MATLRRQLFIEVRSRKLDRPALWARVLDVKGFPDRVPYISDVRVTSTGLGGHYTDVTNIMIKPVLVHHHVVAYSEFEELEYDLPLPYRARMRQHYRFTTEGDEAVVIARINYQFATRWLELMLGPWLERRFFRMAAGLFSDVEIVRRID